MSARDPKKDPKKLCEKCGQMISVYQFSKHEGTKACAEVAQQKKQS